MDFIHKSEENKSTEDQDQTYVPFFSAKKEGDVIHCQASYEMDPAAASKFDELDESAAVPVHISGTYEDDGFATEAEAGGSLSENPSKGSVKFDPSIGGFNAEPGVGDEHYADPLTGYGAPERGDFAAEAGAGGYQNDDGSVKFDPSIGGFNAEPGVGDEHYADPLTGYGAPASVDFEAEAGAGGYQNDDGSVKFDPSLGGFNAEPGVGDENYAKPLTGYGARVDEADSEGQYGDGKDKH